MLRDEIVLADFRQLHSTKTVNHMSLAETRRQCLASSGAILITFIAICHEVVGSTVFPWGPVFFGGPIGWHGFGAFGIMMGSLLFAATLRIIRFPVRAWSILGIAIGLLLVAYTAVWHREFHLFAFSLIFASFACAYFHTDESSAEL